ncbi:MFS transporter [Microbispora bryophytorum]|uniref:MFS transporter n=1 Tax=Microbispora bryophytorum TaxID=1460882 RepID=A0A8H9H9I8_9ACTN|nr:MFS transporter [Microbispora bryophytorum]MBD3135247.1 MFS transporter [Microbispora bryophytorum]TQS08544.1 MFS transporter [Microbispora bryophytorum]GGO30659.1 MFS transporter [Microbispora bryophytorum]
MIARLVAGRTVAALATALIPTGLTLAVIRVTGSALDLGVVLAAEMLPMLLLLPVGGVIADRFPPRRVILVADLVRCAAQVTLGAMLLLGHPDIAVMAGLAALTGAAVAFGVPAVSPLVLGVVPAERRLRVNAHIGVASGLAQIAGPALAGGMTLWLGPGWSFLLTGALFAGSAVTLGGLVTAPRPAAERAHFLGDLREGWGEARRHRWFLVSVAGHGVWHLGAGVLLTLGPVIAVRSLGGEPVWVVVAQAGTAATVLGVFVAPRLPIRRPLAVAAVGAAVYACPLVAFAFPTAFPAPAVAVTAAYVVAMLGVGVLTPLWETVVQQRMEPQALGRVDSFDALISFAARPLGLAAAAPLAAWAGAAAPLLTAAVLVAAVNLAVLALPEVRRRTTEEAAQPPVPV